MPSPAFQPLRTQAVTTKPPPLAVPLLFISQTHSFCVAMPWLFHTDTLPVYHYDRVFDCTIA